MIGEHGDSAVPVWSLARVGGIRLEQLAAAAGVAFNGSVRDQFAQDVRSAAYAVIEGKGATYYAIASGLVRIVEAVVGDQRSLLTVSNSARTGNDAADLGGVWMSMPRTVGRAGILLVRHWNLRAVSVMHLARRPRFCVPPEMASTDPPSQQVLKTRSTIGFK